MKMTVFWDIAPYILIEIDRRFRGAFCLMMEAVNTSEKSVNFYETTRRTIPEDGHLQGDPFSQENCLFLRLF
jgi:hypothetical protein